MKQFLIIPFILLIGLACSEQKQPVEQSLRPVRFVTINDANLYRGRTFSGTSKSSLESRLSFKVSGTITGLPVQIGQRLANGEMIAELDPASYMLQQQQAQATLVEARANSRRTAANYERTKGLYTNDNASLNELESARAQAESAEAVVAAAVKALEIAKLNVSYTKLTAETDCSIASLMVETNENVQAGQTVALVSCGDHYEVTLNLPESLISTVKQNSPVTVEFSAIPGVILEGKVSEIAVATAGAAAFPVVIQILSQHPSLRSGLAANVTFKFDIKENNKHIFTLPLNSVLNDTGETFVFIVEYDGRDGEAMISRRLVKLGELTQDGIEVLEGLVSGDKVVTAGTSVLRDGQRVLVPRS